MRRSQLVTVLVITTLIVGIISVFSLDNTVSAAIVTPSIDEASSSHQIKSIQSTTSSSLTITTSIPQEIIYVAVYSSIKNCRLTVSATPSLTWNYRGGQNTSSIGEMAVWWAVASTAQSFSITFTSTQSTNLMMSAFTVINADTTSPFDPNLSSLKISSGNSKTASTSLTTTNTNDLVVAIAAFASSTTISKGNEFTQIDNTGAVTPAGADEYRVVSNKGTYTPTFTIPSNQKWIIVADAFVPSAQSITITSSPQTGAGYVTVNGTARSTPFTASYMPGTVLALSAAAAVSGGTGTRYVYSSWNDSGAQTHYYTVQSSSETVTANYQAQYEITFAQSGLDSTVASTALTGPILNVNGTSINYAGLPYSIWVNSGDRLVYTYNSTCASTTTEKQFALYSVSAASPLTGISNAQTITGTYQTQYQVTFISSPVDGGFISQANGHYTTGSSVSITANANDDYIFNHWSSDTSSISFDDTTTPTTTMTVNGIGTVTAHFTQKATTALTITSNLDTVDKGNPITISGTLTSEVTTLSGKTIVISYYNGTQLLEVGTALTQADGTYQYVWMVPASLPNGQYIVKADFAGDSQFLDCSSADSGGNLSVNVLPEYAFGGLTAVIICFAAMMLFFKRNKASKAIVN